MTGHSRNTERTRPLRRVHIIALGGTIAGVTVAGHPSTDYQPGVLGIDAVLAGVPGLPELAEVTAEQLANIPSYALTHDLWAKLEQRVRTACAADDCAGVVVTHGTDTLEETAFFLHLVQDSEKPVVVTGAMRPSTATSADGPRNLVTAVAVALSAQAKNRGVLVTLDDRIDSARDVRKLHTTACSAFGSPNWGPVGEIADDLPVFFSHSERAYGGFSMSAGRPALPRVAILHGYSQGDPELVNAAVAAGISGIVHAGMGNGGIFPTVRQALRRAVRAGLAVVSSSHVPAGPMTLRTSDRDDGFVTDRNGLGPLKARVLLALALQREPQADTERLQDIFNCS